MRSNERKFRVDRAEGKWLGVCAGLSRTTGLDANIIRIGLVVITLMGAFPWSLLLYLVAALVGSSRSEKRTMPAFSQEESQARIRSLDLRMQAIETCATTSNSRLAREIEALR